jgi:hypothetical protein
MAQATRNYSLDGLSWVTEARHVSALSPQHGFETYLAPLDALPYTGKTVAPLG